MGALDVLMKIIVHFSKSAKNCCQLANMGDFINYRALKRFGEFYSLKCTYENRMLERYIIGVCNYMPKYVPIESKDIIPAQFYGAHRADVTPDERKKYAEFIMTQIFKWLEETKKLLEKSYVELTNLGEIDIACRIKDLISDFSTELKYFERKKIESDNVQYGAHHMERVQECWHEEFKKRTDDLKIGEM